MKNKDFEYTGLNIKDEVVSTKVNELARKDLIAFVKNCPPDYKTKSLVWNTDFIAEMSKRSICGSIILTEEQQKMIDESNKKRDELMAPINAAIAECASKLTDKLPFGMVRLEVDNKVIATIQLEHTHDDERK